MSSYIFDSDESDVEIKTVKERSLKDSRLLIIDPVNDITYVMASRRNIGTCT